MKKSLFWLLPVFSFLVTACGSDFRDQLAGRDALVSSVESNNAEVHSQYKTSDGTYDIVRYSKVVALQKVETKTDKSHFTMSADLYLNGKSQGPIELVGDAKDDGAILVPKDPQLKDKYRAKLVCVSGDENCSEYFVDFFLRDGKTVYVDQYVKSTIKPDNDFGPAPSTTTTSTTSTTATTQKAGSKVLPKPALPVTTTTTVKSADTSYDDQSEGGDDDDDGNDSQQAGGFVGTSDKEIVGLFDIPVDKPDTDLTQIPKNNPGKIAPVPIDPSLPGNPSKVSPKPTPSQEDMGDSSSDQQTDQAIGYAYSHGRLENATNLLELSQEGYPFKILRPERGTHYSTWDMAQVLKSMATAMQSKIKDFKLTIGDVSVMNGGAFVNAVTKQRSHKGHQNGTDADIAYITKSPARALTDLVSDGKLSPELMLPEQWALTKAAFKTGKVTTILMDPVIKQALCYEAQQEGDLKDRNDRGAGYEVLRRIMSYSKGKNKNGEIGLMPVTGHDTHFHMRVKCGDDNPRCGIQNLTYRDSGCFGDK